MNKTFHSIWNASKQAWVAAAETVSAKGKPTSGAKVAAAIAGLMGSLLGSVAHAQTAPPPNTLPTGGQVSAGQASIGQAGANMVIQQSSNRATINWQSFNVGSNAQVQFQQPDASSVTLNRVLGSDPSQIFGRISANGQVVLSNPAGVYFAPGARVDVGGLTATTLGINDADFMAGKNAYQRSGSSASVVNEGELKAALGGYIALLAPEVRNQGAVIAQMGTVALASGETVELRFDNSQHLTSIRVEPSQIQALVDNRHAVQAPGGLVILSAQSLDRLVGGVVSNSGAIEATGLQSDGGRIVLSGSSKATNSGTLDVNSSTAQGGSVSLQGERIELQTGSRIAATGATGGGTVLVGGNWQGSADPLLQTTGQPTQAATSVTMAQGASIDASATQQGNGGTVVLWSDVGNANSVTQAQGSITAQGRNVGGDGGRVETSGHTLTVGGIHVDAGAHQGAKGLWLLDPTDSTIDQAVANSYASTLNGGTDVLNSVTGNIAWNNGVTLSKTLGSDATLTLKATGNIIFGTSTVIGSTSQKMSVVLWSDSDNSGQGYIELGAGSSISSNGGNIVMGGGAASNGLPTGYASSTTLNGIDFNQVTLDARVNSTLDVNAGNITLRGSSAYGTSGTSSSPNYARGIYLNSSQLYGNNLNLDGKTTSTNLTNLVTYGISSNGGAAPNNTQLNAYGDIVLTGSAANPGTTANQNTNQNALRWGTNHSMASANGNITINALGQVDWLSAQTLTLASGKALIYNSNFNGNWSNVIAGAGGLTKQGSGTLTLSGVNTYTGATTISAGTLALNSTGTIATSSGIANSGNFSIAGDKTIDSMTGTGTTALGSYVLTIGDASNTSATYGGVISGTGSLIKQGTGTVTLSAANTYTGGTTISAGVLAVTGTLANNAGAAITINDGGTLQLGADNVFGSFSTAIVTPITINAGGLMTNSGPYFSRLGPLTLNGGTLSSTDGRTVYGFANPFAWAIGAGLTATGNTQSTISGAGNVQLGSASVTGATFTVNDGTAAIDLEVSANLTNSSSSTWATTQASSLTKAGAGTMRLSGDNLYGGVTNVNAGTLAVSSGMNPGLIDPSWSTWMSGLGSGVQGTTVASGATLDLRGVQITYGEAITLNGGTLMASTGTSGLVGTVTLGANSTVDVGGTQLTLSGVISGAYSLTKTGTGTLTLSGNNTYTGVTTVHAGTLTAGHNNALGTTAGNTVVASNATLAVSDAVNVAEPLQLSGSGANNSGALNLLGTNTYSGAITLAANASIVGGTGTQTLSGNVNGAYALAINSSGAWVQSGAWGNATALSSVTVQSAGTASLGNISAQGTIDVATLAGNLTLTGALRTTNTSSSAVVLNAGKSSNALTSSGGDVIVSGASISVGTGGRATLYAGSISGSTGLTNLVGSGSGRFRYGSDELTANYSTALGAGLHAVYRQQPTVSIASLILGMAYGDALPGLSATGTVNGDTAGYAIGNQVNSSSGNIKASATPYAITETLTGLGYLVNNTSAASTGTLTVDPKAITMGGLSSQNKTYDGTTSATVNGTAALQAAIAAGSGTSSDGKPYTSDAVSISGTATGSYNSKDVATANSVTFSGLSLSGADAGNYSLTLQSPASATITAKTLTVNGLSSQSKTYDGTTSATVNGTAALQAAIAAGSGTSSDGKPYASDVIGLSGTALGSFNSQDVANANQVSFSGLSLSGAAASNYMLTPHAADTSARITQAPLTVTVNNDAKFVVQSDRAGFNGVSMSGFVNGETASVLGGSATITRSNASNNTAGTYTGVLSASGLSSGNYSLTYRTGDYTITPSNQLLIEVTNISTTYGAAAQYAISSVKYENGGTVYTLGNGGVAGSSVSINSSNLVNINDGSGGLASFTLSPQSGAHSTANLLKTGSYQLGPSGTVTANSANFSNTITVVGAHQVNTKGITASASGVSKVYDGTTSMTGVTSGLTTLETNDVVTVNGAGAFASKDVGTGLRYTLSNLVLSGPDANNYHLTGGANFSGSNGTITAAPLTVTANNANKTYDAQAYSGGNGVGYSGFVGGESASVLGGTLSYGGSSQGATNAGSYTIVPSGLSSNNYAISYANGTLTVAKANATVTANSGTLSYNGAYQTVSGFTASGLVGGETAAVLTGVSASRTELNAGTYTTTANGTDSNYNLSFVDGSMVINPATISVMAITGTLQGTVSKVYDGGNAATLQASNYVLIGWAGSDGATVSKTVGTYDNANVGTGKTVTVVLGTSDYSATGNTHLGNYTLPTRISGTVGTITAAPLTVTANNASKTHDGLPYVGGNGVGYSGFVNGETASVLGGTLRYGGSSQGAVDAGNGYTIVLSGLSSHNYAINYANGTLTIYPAAIVINPAPAPVTHVITTNPANTSLSNHILTAPPSSNAATVSSSAPSSPATLATGITVDLLNVNAREMPMMVAVSLPKGTTTVGTGFSFEMPETVKSMAMPNAPLQISQSNGVALPAWLKFDPVTMRFEAASVPDTALPMQLQVNVAGQHLTVVISERGE